MDSLEQCNCVLCSCEAYLVLSILFLCARLCICVCMRARACVYLCLCVLGVHVVCVRVAYDSQDWVFVVALFISVVDVSGWNLAVSV